MCGTIIRTLKEKSRKDTLLKFYKVMAVCTLLYGCETWTLTKNYCKRIQAAEMRFCDLLCGRI